MIPREGKCCPWCGYPLKPGDATVCITCREWINGTGGSRVAAKYAAGESRKDLQKYYEERKR